MNPQPLHFAQYRFILRAETTIQLSYYKGSALRGAFGGAFKRMVCLQPPDPRMPGLPVAARVSLRDDL